MDRSGQVDSTKAGQGAPERARAVGRTGKAVDRRVARTRKAIRKALITLMEQQDYRKISIAAVAREADIDRKTFYLHYDSIEAVIDEIISDEAKRLVDLCRGAIAKGGGTFDVEALYSQMSSGLVTDFSQSRRVLRHISIEDMLDRIEAPLRAGLLEDGSFGFDPNSEYVPYYTAFFCAGLVAVYRRWLLSDSELPLDKVAEASRVALMGGIEGALAASSEADDPSNGRKAAS